MQSKQKLKQKQSLQNANFIKIYGTDQMQFDTLNKTFAKSLALSLLLCTKRSSVLVSQNFFAFSVSVSVTKIKKSSTASYAWLEMLRRACVKWTMHDNFNNSYFQIHYLYIRISIFLSNRIKFKCHKVKKYNTMKSWIRPKSNFKKFLK